MEQKIHSTSNNNPWTVFIQKNPKALMRLFCFHYGGGSASAFINWASKIPTDIELIAIQLPGREGRFGEPCVGSVSELVEKVLPAIKPLLNKPYVIFGHSLGAINAFEVIRAIKRQQLRQPELFIPSGVKAPEFPYNAQHISHLPDSLFVAALKERYKSTIGNLLDTPEVREVFLPQLRADFNLIESYKFVAGDDAKFGCPILALAGEMEYQITEEQLNCWKNYTNKKSESKRFPGGHFFIQEQEDDVLALVVEKINSIKNKIKIAA